MLLCAAVEKNGRDHAKSCDELLRSLPLCATRRCKSVSALKENINEVLILLSIQYTVSIWRISLLAGYVMF